MKDRLQRAVRFWKEHVFRHRGLWVLALGLHPVFFALSYPASLESTIGF